MEIEKLVVFRPGGELEVWSGVGVETRQTFITDITDLTDRPSGNPRMDVRDITAITLNMIRCDVTNNYILKISRFDLGKFLTAYYSSQAAWMY